MHDTDTMAISLLTEDCTVYIVFHIKYALHAIWYEEKLLVSFIIVSIIGITLCLMEVELRWCLLKVLQTVFYWKDY